MPGRQLCSEEEAISRGFGGPDCARRRQVLRETITVWDESDPPDRFHRLAIRNLARWHSEGHVGEPGHLVQVFPGDWGEVAQALTRTHGACFAVLNMANAYVPGGAYVEGAVAQEENLFRRSDAHFQIGEDEYDSSLDCYRPAMTRLLSAGDGRVYLDVHRPRVCIRGAEDRSRADLGYSWLPDDEVFPFFELRAAAVDLRDGSGFEPEETRRRVAAQLYTLREHGIRHVVFGAFGCGAFRNPADRVARIYREEIAKCISNFSVVAFAVFYAGYGPNNYISFAEAFQHE